jgi:hypothetical protein
LFFKRADRPLVAAVQAAGKSIAFSNVSRGGNGVVLERDGAMGFPAALLVPLVGLLPSFQRSVLTEFVTSTLFPPPEFADLRPAALQLHAEIGFL